MPCQSRLAAAAFAAVALAAAGADDESAALAADDQCADDDADCAFAAMQLRGQKVAAAVAADETAKDESQWPTCARFGCQSAYVPGQMCQCTADCQKYFNCCPDYWQKCWQQHGHSQPQSPSQAAHAGMSSGGCYHTNNFYKLNWEAQGANFFDQFTFVSQDDVHGAHQFTNRSEAEAQGTVTNDGGRAQLRFGGTREPSYDGEAWKRYSVNLHTNKAWNPQPGFVAALHYERLPHGCGIWPSFWAMNSDKVWPAGGELDILEYANDERNKVTFHIDSKCYLDTAQIDKCAPQGHTNLHSNACETNYFENKLGCMPKQKQPSGSELANSPGVMAAEWATDHITIFHIPEAEIPQDLKEDRPQPSTWGRWVVAYLPFKPGCAQFLGEQELVLNLQLCGDWAGATWEKHGCQAQTGQWKGMCEIGLSQPSDCCTKYVTSWAGGNSLKNQFMDIKSLKVYTANGAVSKNSGTFVRGGVPLTA